MFSARRRALSVAVSLVLHIAVVIWVYRVHTNVIETGEIKAMATMVAASAVLVLGLFNFWRNREHALLERVLRLLPVVAILSLVGHVAAPRTISLWYFTILMAVALIAQLRTGQPRVR
ncbi:MAG: hypothetical protein IT353_16185 [Gemmatimonadaceae bacterium]|nr:hypothetical protein [Gemmatimonadaceae bacterium]